MLVSLLGVGGFFWGDCLVGTLLGGCGCASCYRIVLLINTLSLHTFSFSEMLLSVCKQHLDCYIADTAVKVS